MVTLTLFLLVVVLVAAGIGRAVRHQGLPFDVEPDFARLVLTGLVIVWLTGLANADRLDRLRRDLAEDRTGRIDHHPATGH